MNLYGLALLFFLAAFAVNFFSKKYRNTLQQLGLSMKTIVLGGLILQGLLIGIGFGCALTAYMR